MRNAIPAADIERQIHRMTVLNRGFALDVNAVLGYDAIFREFPSLNHVAKCVTAILAEDRKTLPTPSEIRAVHAKIAADARPKANCKLCGGNGFTEPQPVSHRLPNGVVIRGTAVQPCPCRDLPADADSGPAAPHAGGLQPPAHVNPQPTQGNLP